MARQQGDLLVKLGTGIGEALRVVGFLRLHECTPPLKLVRRATWDFARIATRSATPCSQLATESALRTELAFLAKTMNVA